MKCLQCNKKPVFDNPNYCKDHFIKYVENKIFDTIKKYKLIKKNDKVAVAASGGKDSLTLLHNLNKKFDVEAIAIDEGIELYREKTLKDLKKFCKKENILLKIYSYKKNFKKNLDDMHLHNKTPCAVCGTFRRYLLNKYSQNYDVLAIGHNLDDESQAIAMNLLKSHSSLAMRIGPKTGSIEDDSFTKRVKPLYFLTEREIKAYTILKKFNVSFAECPNMHESFRGKIRQHLNVLEQKMPNSKKNLVNSFLQIKSKLPEQHHQKINHCAQCGFVSSGNLCMACRYAAEV